MNPRLSDAAKVTWMLLQPILNRSEREGYLVENGEPMNLSSLAGRLWKTESELESELQELIRCQLLKTLPNTDDTVTPIFDPMMVLDKKASESVHPEEQKSLNGDSSLSGNVDSTITHKSRVEESKRQTQTDSYSTSTTGTGGAAATADAASSPTFLETGTTAGSATSNWPKALNEWIAKRNMVFPYSDPNMIIPPELADWAHELQPQHPKLDLNEVAKKWADYCQENEQKMTRKWFEGYVQREKPAKADVGTAKKKPAKAKAKVEPKQKTKAELKAEEKAIKDKEEELAAEQRRIQSEKNALATAKWQARLDAEREAASKAAAAKAEADAKAKAEAEAKAKADRLKELDAEAIKLKTMPNLFGNSYISDHIEKRCGKGFSPWEILKYAEEQGYVIKDAEGGYCGVTPEEFDRSSYLPAFDDEEDYQEINNYQEVTD